MNLRDLINKLDTIAEADATGRIDYQANQAQDAKEKAIADVKKMANTPMNSIPRFGVAINPKTGQIFYGEDNETGQTNPRGYPFKWMQPGGPAESIKDGDRIRAAGLEIIEKSGYAYVDPGKLSTIDQPANTMPASTPAANKPADDTAAFDSDVKKLQDLTQQLRDLIGKKPVPNPQVTKPISKPQIKKPISNPQVKEPATMPQVNNMGDVTGYQESTNSGIASTLVESFGYQLLEYPSLPAPTSTALTAPIRTGIQKFTSRFSPGTRTPGIKNMGMVQDVTDLEVKAASKLKTAPPEVQAAVAKSGGVSEWIKKNPKQAVALGLITGAGIGAMLSGNGSTPPKEGDIPRSDGPANPPVANPQVDTKDGRDEIIKQMEVLMRALGDTEDTVAQSAITQASDVINQARGLGHSKLADAPASTAPTPSGQAAPTDLKFESDGELARWLKIARS